MLTNLLRQFHHILINQHVAWDLWSEAWQEHSRNKPNLEYTRTIWLMTKGYLEANIDNKNALLRERLTNYAILCLMFPEQNFEIELKNLEKEFKPLT